MSSRAWRTPDYSGAATLAPHNPCVRIRCAKHGNEHVCLELDAAIAREDRHGGAREVGEQLLAGAVLLAH